MNPTEHHRHHGLATPPATDAERASDPVCGMAVVRGSARGSKATHAGDGDRSCHPCCRDNFAAGPAAHLATDPAALQPPRGAILPCNPTTVLALQG